MRISTFFYTLRQGFANLFRNKWFSLASIATISACLFLFGVFYAIMMNFQNMVYIAEENLSITVFFHNEWDDCCYDEEGNYIEDYEVHTASQIPDEDRLAQIGELIAARDEVSQVNFISADEAWETFGYETFGENYNDGFTYNPLRGMDCYEVFLSDVSKHDDLVTWLYSIPEVEQINDESTLAGILTGGNQLISYVTVAVIVILLLVSIFLIRNTIATGIAVRREEINIMKYIGATDFFVRAPFVIEGMLIGLLGAAIPLGLTYSLYNYVVENVSTNFAVLSSFLTFLPTEEVFNFLTPVSLIVGVGIGFFGSFSTARKHLQV